MIFYQILHPNQKTKPFGNWTTIDLLNTEHVWYSNSHLKGNKSELILGWSSKVSNFQMAYSVHEHGTGLYIATQFNTGLFKLGLKLMQLHLFDL